MTTKGKTTEPFADCVQTPGWVIGLDLGGTKLASALFSVAEDGNIGFVRALKNKTYDDILGAEQDRNTGTAECSRRIEDAMVASVEELRGGRSPASGSVGICSAGFVENGMIIEAWNTGMKNYPLRRNVARRTGMRAFLYKDAWAPVFGLQPCEPSIIFSIGTGLGGVSCEPGNIIEIRSYTSRHKPKWIPHLYCNDDPGYAVSFSRGMLSAIIERVIITNKTRFPGTTIPTLDNSTAPALANKIFELGRARGRLTPSRPELFAARILAPKAVAGMRPGAVFADLVCAAETVPFLYECISGRQIAPAALDLLLVQNDPAASLAALIHAWFIGYTLFRMQKERIEFKLPSARKIFGTGSGFNKVNAPLIGKDIVDAMNAFCAEAGIEEVKTGPVELIDTGEMPTTFACMGAAAGAAMGIK